MKKFRFVFALVLTLILASALASPAFAAGADMFADTTAEGTHEGSLFVAGQNVDSRADVHGVLLAAGYDVRTGGKSEYVMAAGSTTEFFGAAENDVFLAGNTVVVTGSAARDVFAAANTFTLSGSVGRGTYIAADTVKISGSIGGDAYINANKIVITDGAFIGGRLHCNSSASVTGAGAAAVKVERYESASRSGSSEAVLAAMDRANFGRKVISRVISFLGVTALAFVLLWLTPLWETVDKKYCGAPFASYASAFGIGFAVLAGLPVAAILLMLTRVGLRLAFVLLFVYVAAIIAAPVFLGFFLGMLIWRGALKKAPCYFAELPIGILVWRLAACIPGLSFAVGLVAVPLGLGVITLLLGKGTKSAPAAPADGSSNDALPEAAALPAAGDAAQN